MRLSVLALCSLIAGCGTFGGPPECDSGPYQAAAQNPKVVAPEGLDNLNPFDEMPLPEASPQEPWPADGPCLEQPPQIIRMN